MSRKLGVIVTILSVLALCASLFAIVQVKGMTKDGAKEDSSDVQYVMYLGTNDKDTNEPVFEPAKAKEEAEKILLNHFGGYTIQEADGGWVGEGKVFTEYTLVIYLSDTDKESVHAAADEMIETFRQSSILIHENKTTTEFYAGKGGQ